MKTTDDAAPEDDAAPDDPPTRIPAHARRPISSPSDEFLNGARHGGQAFAEGAVLPDPVPDIPPPPPGPSSHSDDAPKRRWWSRPDRGQN
jgi:hypothetical protein